jgi:hypothetical protein
MWPPELIAARSRFMVTRLRVGSVPILERPPVRLRAGMHDSAEVLAEIPRRTEAAALRHRVNREVTPFEKSLRQMDPLALQPLMRSSRWRPEIDGQMFGGSWPHERPGH